MIVLLSSLEYIRLNMHIKNSQNLLLVIAKRFAIALKQAWLTHPPPCKVTPGVLPCDAFPKNCPLNYCPDSCIHRSLLKQEIESLIKSQNNSL